MKKADGIPGWVSELSSSWLVGAGTVLTLLQFIFVFIARSASNPVWEWAGWICLWSAGIFGILPIISFRKHGRVHKGKSYIHTTRLVKNGLYALVRHPQNGTAWILINFGLMLIARHWSSFVTGGLSILLAYLDTYKADERCIEKFGNAYRDYLAKVPRVNFLYGILLRLKKRMDDGEK